MKHTPKAFIQRDGKILILKRTWLSRNFPSTWDFPGGKPKPDETPEQTLTRETKEESNLDIVVGKRLGIYYGKGKDEFEFTIYAVEADGDVKLSKDHSEFRWATEAEIRALKTMPFMNPFLDER